MKWLCLLLIPVALRGQSDSLMTIPLVGVHLAGDLPSRDMAQRFGPNLSMGGVLAVKTKRSWIFGIETIYFFGRNVHEDVLSQLRTHEGNITDNNGFPADLRVTERGAAAHVFVGRLFPLLSANRNSGLMVWVGAGGLQHRIKLYDAQQAVAGVKGHLSYGFDRFSAGPSLTQFIGYLFIGDNRLLNFYFGVECYEAFTRSVRKLNYDTGLPDTRQRTDVLTGFRFGWILPLYKKTPDEFYYY